MESFELNDGVRIPKIGFGTYLIPNDGSTYKAVRSALDAGYRHIDTAAAYFNEEEVGRAVAESGIPREDIFITSKLWLQDYGYEGAKKGIARSLRHLGTHIDLYLIHQPTVMFLVLGRRWRRARQRGDIRSIGVSNMTPKIWNSFVPQFETIPSVNQVEFNPTFQQKDLRAITDELGVRIEAYFPLGHGNRELLTNPALMAMAEKYGKNVGQIILRAEIQDGAVVLPKSTNPQHIAANLDIFDFALTDEEMAIVHAMDTGKPSHDPDANGVEEMLRSAFVIED
ncbi:organophosphate reductase [Bifidobacterium tsurumiense]|uniref:Organophosphate reductase n=2 Tax=Bifidobacterium tsurumiense TaxID=356829 RepID=A0A087EE73_9BIFI|nr:organophosphate reductase [Bifidobacterium tsurumiense]